jgi:ArsR family transcriptional regulator
MNKSDFQILERKAEIFKAMAHPVRLLILKDLLENGPKIVSKLEAGKIVTLPIVSQHLAKLRHYGLINQKKKGIQVYSIIVNKELISMIINADI